MLNGFPFMYLIYYKTYSLSAKAIKKHRWLPQIEYIVSLSGLGGGMVGKISMKSGLELKIILKPGLVGFSGLDMTIKNWEACDFLVLLLLFICLFISLSPP